MASTASKLVAHICITILCLDVICTDGLRILGLFPLQMKSPSTTSEALMRGLAAKGHQVDVYSHFPLKSPVPNYNDFSLKGTLPEMSNNVTFNEVKISQGVEDLMKYWIHHHGSSICNLLELPIFQKLLKNPPNDPPYDLIINEFSVVQCYIPLGRRLNVPVIGIMTMPSLFDWMYAALETPFNLAVEPSFLAPYFPPMTFFQRLNNVVTSHYTMYAYKKYTQEHDRIVEKIYGPGLPSQIDLIKDLSLVLINHHDSLGGVKTFPPRVVPVGGLHVVDLNETLPKDVQDWLDNSKAGCLYFTFGSMTRIETFPENVIEAIYRSFEKIAPVRVLMKIAKSKELSPGLPSNVMIQPWFNQIQILKHKNIKAFITHGGLMGTQESIHYGIPMIGIPLFGDQMYNVKAYAEKKIAIKVDLDEITEETFTRALKEILHNPVYRDNIKKVSAKFKDRPISAMDTAIFWVEYISRHGKDDLKSIAAEMPWWQASLLDVYGFIGLLTIASVYVIVKVLKIVFRTFCTKQQTSSSSRLKKSQ